MIATFKEFVLKFTRGPLSKYVKENDFTSNNSKAKIMSYLQSQGAPQEVIEDFKKIWDEFKLIH